MGPGRRRGGGGGAGERRSPPWDRIHPTLDLHGETGDDARELAERWLLERRRDGERVVRIVTGRGLHSVGPPVLPGVISELLRRLRGTVVAAWEGEPGGGAYRVELRRPEPRSGPRGPGGSAPSPAAAGPAAPSRENAELRRRAEESLAELGITPTQALIAAEMRRLSREEG